jgi:hypothetical protein
MAFRIGRKTAQHTYPEARRNTTVALARNSAYGPTAGDTEIVGAGQAVVWNVIESGAPADNKVPITPKSTGAVRISAVISLTAEAGAAVLAQVRVTPPVGPPVVSPVPLDEQQAYLARGVIPILITLPLTVGATSHVAILLTVIAGNDVFIRQSSSTLDLQEVVPVTG